MARLSGPMGLLACGLGLLMFTCNPAQAQIGFGFGGWGHNAGTWLGTWINVWPGYWGGRPWARPRTQPVTKQAGQLEGVITIRTTCPTAQPNQACPTAPQGATPVQVTAVPTGSRQAVITQADGQGRYRLELPPGAYTVQFEPLRLEGVRSNAVTVTDVAPVTRQISISPGKTRRFDLQMDRPLR